MSACKKCRNRRGPLLCAVPAYTYWDPYEGKEIGVDSSAKNRNTGPGNCPYYEPTWWARFVKRLFLFCLIVTTAGCMADVSVDQTYAVKASKYIESQPFINAEMELVRTNYTDRYTMNGSFNGVFFLATGAIDGSISSDTESIFRCTARFEDDLIQVQLPYYLVDIKVADIPTPKISIQYWLRDDTRFRVIRERLFMGQISRRDFGFEYSYRDHNAFIELVEDQLQHKTQFVLDYAIGITATIRPSDVETAIVLDF